MPSDLLMHQGGKLRSKAVIGGMREDEWLQSLLQPTCDYWSPFDQPWKSLLDLIASDDSEKRVSCCDSVPQGSAGLAGL